MVRHVERKAISPGTKNLLYSLHCNHNYTYSQLSVPCVEWGIPSRCLRISPDPFPDYARVEYTTYRVHQFGYARLVQIHVLPAREVTVLSIASH
jgi:hypothetical protein